MVRTKADGGGGGSATRKAVAARAPRKALGSASTSGGADGSSPSAAKYAGGNPVCTRPTPEWQKDITKFFQMGQPKKDKNDKENSVPDDNDDGVTVLEEEPVAGGSGSSKS